MKMSHNTVDLIVKIFYNEKTQFNVFLRLDRAETEWRTNTLL